MKVAAVDDPGDQVAALDVVVGCFVGFERSEQNSVFADMQTTPG